MVWEIRIVTTHLWYSTIYTAREQAVNERCTNTTASVTTNEVNPKQNRRLAEIINGGQNASRHKNLQSTHMIRYASNFSQITAAENITNYNKYGSNNDTIIITYEYIGYHLWLGHIEIKHIIKKVSVAWKHYGYILQLDVFHINIGWSIFIENTSREQEKIHWDVCSREIYNHADTHCFGRNIWPISFISEECMISPFPVHNTPLGKVRSCTLLI